jgi:NCAIR mutase (PurE)-related protein
MRSPSPPPASITSDDLFRVRANCDNGEALDPDRLKSLLEDVRRGRRGIDSALEQLRRLPYEDIGFAKVDHHRALRQGIPEVVFAQGKTRAQIVEIAARLAAGGHDVVVTRIDGADAKALAKRLPGLRYSAAGRVAWRGGARRSKRLGRVLVISAGTADLPVAEEAAVTAECSGCEVERVFDVGVSGLHRLFDQSERIRSADVIIVVAGMEGALPSVVAGWVGQPVVAVPTSVGYGASFGGLAALLSMLNSCAAGTTVVNIDNGFGAAIAAVRILRGHGRPRR